MEKFDIQANQYAFPYHYIPYLQADGCAMRTRKLRWGLEYLCYQHHAVQLVAELNPASVLEVGCGDGRFIGMLQDKVARCVGVDLVESAIKFASAFHPRVDFRCVDVDAIAEEFSVVAAIEVLEHIPDAAVPGFIRSMCQRIRQGGHLVLCVPSDVRPVQKKHYRHYNEALLDSHVRSGGVALDLVSVQHVYDPPWWWNRINNATCGERLSLEIPALNRRMWQYIWRHRLAAPGKGRHVVAVYRKP